MCQFQQMVAIMNKEIEILEGQLRECFGRVVYSHKTHEKCADILLERLGCLKLGQIALSAVITGGLVSALFEFDILVQYEKIGLFVGTVLSTILLVLNSYVKDENIAEIAQKHRQIATDLWIIREEYLSLLTDLHMENLQIGELIQKRDELIQRLYLVYKKAPSTNHKAYKKAQKALKKLEDMTFSDDEIDIFLHNELKRRNQN